LPPEKQFMTVTAQSQGHKVFDEEKYEQQILENIVEKTNQLKRKYHPTCMLLCLDGVCPRAKMVQQRYRRYMNVAGNSRSVNQKTNSPIQALINIEIATSKQKNLDFQFLKSTEPICAKTRPLKFFTMVKPGKSQMT
jgi:5'-3' exonuclease